jgi:hypothetical protein
MIDRLLNDPNKTFREGLDIEVEEFFHLLARWYLMRRNSHNGPVR